MSICASPGCSEPTTSSFCTTHQEILNRVALELRYRKAPRAEKVKRKIASLAERAERTAAVLRERGPLSVNQLAADLQVSPRTARRWVNAALKEGLIRGTKGLFSAC